MKEVYVLLLCVLLTNLSNAQYPILDDFTSINGLNEWQAVTPQTDMCAHGTHLCYNCNFNYLNNQYYSYESPNYGNRFFNDGCDSIYVQFEIDDVRIRTTDQLQFWWYDGVWSGVVIPSAGVWYINLSNNIQLLSFDFLTGGGITSTSNYIHIDYLFIDCMYTLLSNEIYDFECKEFENGIAVSADISDVSDLELEWSNNGYDWELLTDVNTSYLAYVHNTNSSNNYYRIKHDNQISNTIYCSYSNVKKLPIESVYYNVLGQRIKNKNGTYIESTRYDDGSVENKIKINKN